MKIFVTILFLLIISPAVFACTCVNAKNYSDAEYRKMLKQVKAIFYGEVTSLGEQRFVELDYGKVKPITSYQTVNFKVLRVWKGIDFNEIAIETEAASSCQYIPQAGSKVIIYAYPNKNTKTSLFMNQCSVGLDDDRMKRELGEGKVLAQSQTLLFQPAENGESFLETVLKQVISLFS